MLNYNNLFEIEFRKIVEEELLKAREGLGNGFAADYADYKMQVGKMKGLKLALDYCDEVQSIISRRN
jgi:hypothetical protein